MSWRHELARTLAVASISALIAACGGDSAESGSGIAASPPGLDTSMLVEYTPASEEEIRLADPVALAYLAKAWTIAGDLSLAAALLDELERRGRDAFGIGFAWAPFPPVNAQPNPADTVYIVTLVQVADAFRLAGRNEALQRALAELDAVPMASGGSCWPNSVYDIAAGCLHDVNLITMAFLSRLSRNVERELGFSLQTMLEPGAWLFWEEAPPGYWAYRRVMDSGHLGWSAFELMQTLDPRLSQLGFLAALYVSRTYDPARDPFFATYAVAAAQIVAQIPGGCALASTLPAWARDNATNDPDRKNRQWAAYVHVWAQQHCR